MISRRGRARVVMVGGMCAALAATLVGLLPACSAAQSSRFVVTYTPQVSAKPFTGRVYVMLSARSPLESRLHDDWLEQQPLFAIDVRAWKPGEHVVLDDSCLGYPAKPSRLEPGEYAAQAVMDLRTDTREIGSAPGNGHSAVVRVRVESGRAFDVSLAIDRLVPPRRFRETDRVRLVDMKSPLLSRFYGREVRMQAAVVLPEGYNTEPARRYPTVYVIPGFGGDHRMARAIANGNSVVGVGDIPAITVVLNPDAATGHHVFADSANNGPRGAALVRELIPRIERSYRCVAEPGARFLNGHSSGGWSALWLQIAYPDVFGGAWATSPDPVDFRAFQTVDIYAPDANAFRDRAGRAHPIARSDGRVLLAVRQLSDLEQVLGKGGQLGSFEAVFGPRGADGRPQPLWDRRTGRIDPAVARAWRRYDIRAILEERWTALRDKLRGKLHIVVGGKDTFYLERAVRLLKDALRRLGSDADVEILPERDHFDVLTLGLRDRFGREVMQAFADRAKVQAARPRALGRAAAIGLAR